MSSMRCFIGQLSCCEVSQFDGPIKVAELHSMQEKSCKTSRKNCQKLSGVVWADGTNETPFVLRATAQAAEERDRKEEGDKAVECSVLEEEEGVQSALPLWKAERRSTLTLKADKLSASHVVIEGRHRGWGQWVCCVLPISGSSRRKGAATATAGANGAAAAGVASAAAGMRAGRLDVHSMSAATFCRAAAASLAAGCGTTPCSTEHLQLRAKATHATYT